MVTTLRACATASFRSSGSSRSMRHWRKGLVTCIPTRLRGSRTASAALAAPGLTRIHAVEACRRPLDSSTLQSRQVKVIAMTFFTSGHLEGSTYSNRDVGAAAHLISCIQGRRESASGAEGPRQASFCGGMCDKPERRREGTMTKVYYSTVFEQTADQV